MRKAALVSVLFLRALLLAPPALRAEEVPRFLIESIAVEGASAGAQRIVVAESLLRPGNIYDETELRDATARIQRLPFVVSTDFRLARGSSFGKYALIIRIQQIKPLFLDAESTTTWSVDQRFFPQPGGGLEIRDELNQSRTGRLVLGSRAFLGSAGVLNLAAERVEHRNDRYTASYSQYDLFGTRASFTVLASYLESPGARGRGAPGDRFDWHLRDNITYEAIAVLPLGANDSLRASWQREQRPISYFVADPQTQQLQHNLRSLPEIRTEVFWIHDTTNDPLFPTSGTRMTAGAVRSNTPTSSFLATGRRKLDELRASAERSWSITPTQALTLGGIGSDNDQLIRTYGAYATWGLDLWGRERTLRYGDLRLELGADRVWTRIRSDPFQARSTVHGSVVFRNAWGVLRLSADYQGWRND